MTLAQLADTALKVNLAWYILLFALFAGSGNLGKALYFLGAAILTIGVIIL